MNKVAITGIGMVTPLGHDRETTWRRVLAGESGAAKITQFDSTGWPIDVACEVKDFHYRPESVLPGDQELLNRPSEFGVQAAWEAIQDAGDLTHVRPERLGVCVGAGIGTISPKDILHMLRHYTMEQGFAKLAAYLVEHGPEQATMLQNHPGMLAHLLARRWGARGACHTYTTACSASGQAIGYGMQAIQEGRADAMIVAGADSLSGEMLLAGFSMLGVLSSDLKNPEQASKPFDRERDGFVASEGAAVLVLEELQMAKARGARIYATVDGYGESENAYRITDLPEDGAGALLSMRRALAGARVQPKQIKYINAHGTGTEQNDRVEAGAIEKLFYDNDANPYVSSTKSEIGHLVAAAGAVEAAFTALCLRDQKIPPSRNLSEHRCNQRIRFATEPHMTESVDFALSNSFGFGGTNASIVLGAYLHG